MPMLRALPAMVRTAASMSAAVRSGILVVAICSACLRVSLPTLSVCGVLLPFCTPAAFLIRMLAGGVFMMKVKLLSAKAVITTGIGRPGSTFCVCALNALQNSMMFRPRCPSAGPIGGLGLALPAGTCSLIKPTIFFAIYHSLWVQAGLKPSPVKHHCNFKAVYRAGAMAAATSFALGSRLRGRTHLRLFDLPELQFYRCRAAEDRDRHAQLRLVVVDVFHEAVKIGERAFLDAHPLAHFEQHLGLGFLDPLLHLVHDVGDFLDRDRRRLACRAGAKAR